MGASERGGFGGDAGAVHGVHPQGTYVCAGGAAAADVDFECVRRGKRAAGGAPCGRGAAATQRAGSRADFGVRAGDAVFGVGADCFRHSAPVAGADGAVFVGRAGRGTVFGCVLVGQAGVSAAMGRRGADVGGDLSGFGQAQATVG